MANICKRANSCNCPCNKKQQSRVSEKVDDSLGQGGHRTPRAIRATLKGKHMKSRAKQAAKQNKQEGEDKQMHRHKQSRQELSKTSRSRARQAEAKQERQKQSRRGRRTAGRTDLSAQRFSMRLEILPARAQAPARPQGQQGHHQQSPRKLTP